MKLTNKLILASFVASMVAVPSVKADDMTPTYMRSSIYAVLVQSDTQDKRIQEETENVAENEFVALTQGLAKTDEKKAANATDDTPLSALPQKMFLELPIPANFNDHNLDLRVVKYDQIKAGLSDDEIKAFAPKKSGGAKVGGFLKAAAGAALSSQTGKESTMLKSNEEFDDAIPAVLNKFFTSNNVPEQMVAKWWAYDANGGYDQGMKWSDCLIQDRFEQNMSEEDRTKARANSDYRTILSQKQYDLMNNTFVVGINFRFRSNKAIAAELEALGGSLVGAVAGFAGGDGFTVQALTSLYRLEWNDEVLNHFGDQILGQNASFEDLVAAGICKLVPVGKPEKSSASVRQSKLSDKPMSDLVKRATARSFDSAIAKLMEKNEEFRIVTPIAKCDDAGNVYAQIGMKEGIQKGDEYEILEMQEDAQGRVVYKAVGKVKAVDKQIWNNLYGAADEAADNAKNPEGAEDLAADDAIALGYTTFAGAKKGQDYSGYYLRLKKKK